MRTSEAIGSGTGNPKSKTLRNWLDVIAGGTLRMRFIPFGKYRDKAYSLFSNAKYRGHSSPQLGERNVLLPIDPFSDSVSGEVVEIGVLGPQIPEEVSWQWIAGWAEEAEITDSRHLRITWSAIPAVNVDASAPISSVTISGANRFSNCEEIEEFPSRARIRYVLTASGTTRYLKYYSYNTLVASGSRTGDGLITLTEENDSGLSGAAVVAYTSEKTGFFELRWAGSYQVYYSSLPIVWTDDPSATVTDRGTDSFTYLSPTLPAGLVYFGVRAVGDDGVLEAIPQEASDSPLTVQNVPEPPTNLAASGNYNAITVTWTNSTTPSCRYTVYASLVDEPPNIDNLWPDPVPITTGIGVTSAVLAPIANWTPNDKNSVWNTFTTACNTWMTAINLTLDSSLRTTHYDSVTAIENTLLDAVKTLGDAIDRDFNQFSQMIKLVHLSLKNAGKNTTMPDADWLAFVTQFHAKALDAMSFIYNGKKGNFQMPDGSVPLTPNSGNIDFSIYDYVKPLVQNRIVRVIVRATNLDGVQETTDYCLEVELDANGDVVIARPNEPAFESISSAGLTVTVNTLWQEEDSLNTATTIQLWAKATGIAPDPTTPDATDLLVTGINGSYRASPYVTVGSEGYYDFYIAALADDGGQSNLIGPKTRWVSDDDPLEAQNVDGQIIRS